jgi:all-trans-8'-apo-beta-carotenal 15,15'-oxygenase
MHTGTTRTPPRRRTGIDPVWAAALETCPSEVDVTLPCVEGALPAGLRGTLYRNGPGRMEAGGVPYEHPFDGDGLILRFALTASGVRYSNRFVRTREALAEAQAGRMIYRAFGTNLPGGFISNLGRMQFKNAANTSVVLHGGRLYALWEGGLPHLLDPATLATLSRHDFDGALLNRGPDRLLAPELPFSAHPKVDAATGELCNFGTQMGSPHRLLLYRVGLDGMMREVRALPMKPLSFVHDFVLTENHWVFFLTPVAFGVMDVLLGRVSPAASLRAKPGTRPKLLLVPRGGGAPRTATLSPSFVFHHAGGWEVDGKLIVDSLQFDRYPDVEALVPRPGGAALPTPILVRTTVDLATLRVEEQRLSEHPGELPRTDAPYDGAPHRLIWAISRPPASAGPRDSWQLTGISRYDTATGQTLFRDFAPDLVGEPIPVLTEQGRWILTVVYRAAAHRSELVVLDADTLGTVCRFALPHHVPPGFHGTFIPSLPAAS